LYNKTHILLFLMILTNGCESGRNDNSDSDDDAGISQDAGSSDSDADADADASGDTDASIEYECEGECPEDMMEVPDMCACIDSYEFTNEEYLDFLNSRKSNECDGYMCRYMGLESDHISNLYETISEDENPDYITGEDIVEVSDGEFEMLEGVGQFPAGYITYYGAEAACNWKGKRLCPVEIWYAACSHGEQWHYPYGGTTGGVGSYAGFLYDYVQDNCNTGGCGYTSKVGTFPDCEGGYSGIFDMTGNVSEWAERTAVGEFFELGGNHYTNNAEDGEPDNGAGCYFHGREKVAWDGIEPENGAASFVGFRCCVMGNP